MRWQGLLLVPLLVLVSGSGGDSASKFTALHATRTIMPEYHLDPFDVTVRDAQTVQHLYMEALALPVLPAGAVYFCLADFGLVYHLDFLAQGFPAQQMSLDATGCRFLHIGQYDTRMTNQAFLDDVAQTLGLSALVPRFSGQLAPDDA